MNLPMFMVKKHLTFSTVLENGVLYQVFMNDGLMTGIFLDQHEVRGSLVDGLAMGKSFAQYVFLYSSLLSSCSYGRS